MPSRQPRIFYGYWVLTACFVFNVIGSGLGPIGFSFFVTSLEKSLNWSRTGIMTAFTVFFVCTAIGATVSGRLAHRFGAKKVLSAGAITLCVAFILISQMDYLWQYYIGYALVGFGVTGLGSVITTLIVSNWFVRRRGIAIGLLSMGPGTAGLIFTPLVIIVLLPNLGWSNTYLVFAGITVIFTIPLAAFVIRSEPAEKGLQPDGQSASLITGINEAVNPTTQGLPFKSALSTSTFWLLGFAFLFISTHMGVMQSQLPHLEDLGFTPGIVALAMTIVAIMSALGTVIFGWLSDRIKIKTVGVVSVLLIIVSIALLLYVEITSPQWLIWTYATLLGLGVGGWMTSMSLLTSSNFGMLAYGAIYGMFMAFQSAGAAVAPIFSGYFYDRNHSFDMAFITTLIIVALGLPAILSIRRPQQAEKQAGRNMVLPVELDKDSS
jgi:MFS family permease